MPPKESIVYSPTSAPLFPLFLPLSICVQILNHVGMGENESGKGPARRRRKRGWNGKRSDERGGSGGINCGHRMIRGVGRDAGRQIERAWSFHRG